MALLGHVRVASTAAVVVGLVAAPAHPQSPTGTESEVAVDGVVIRYAVTGPADGEPVLLIGGTETQLTDWPRSLITGLVAGGFRVIAFDHRDAGLSTHFEDAGAPNWPAIFGALDSGETPPVPYTLEDMAEDAAGLLDALAVERAHLIGASMGGMIAQIIAASYPNRTLSLTSVAAGSGNPEIRIPANPELMATVPPRPPASDTAAVIERQLALWTALGSPGYPTDERVLRERIEASIARAYDPAGADRQGAAVLAAGDLRDRLRTIRAPTVVIHGADDPLVPVEAGRDVAENVPGAESFVIPGMGHDLPDALVPVVLAAITRAAERAARPDDRD